MARYFIKTPCFVEDRYFQASPQNPLVIDLKDDTPPSRNWEPMDMPALKALHALADADIKSAEKAKNESALDEAKRRKSAYKVLSPLDVAQRKHVEDETATMSDLRKATQGKLVGG